jgi:uridine kinase
MASILDRDIEAFGERILASRRAVPLERSVLAAVTGIDGCGKGFVTARLVDFLAARGARATGINIDGWLNLPAQRFDDLRPAEHFYAHAIRFEEMFSTLVLPLRDRRSIRVTMDYAEETATTYRKQTYEFDRIEVIVLEGIYLLKREFQAYYDLSCWIECSFDTALQRAISRAQEGLSEEATVHAYKTLYFPAQEIHFERDRPQESATFTIRNDEPPLLA